MSGFSPDLPPRITFFRDVRAIHAELAESVAEQLGDEPDDYNTEVFFFTSDADPNKSNRYPGVVQGSDEVNVSEFLSYQGHDGHSVTVELFRRGRTHIPHRGDHDENYVVLSTPDTLPTIINEYPYFLARQAIVNSGHVALPVGITQWIEASNRFGEEHVHLLDDDECVALTGVLRQVQADVDLEWFRREGYEPEPDIFDTPDDDPNLM